MQLRFRSRFDVSREALWTWHSRPGAFERLNPPFDPAEVVEHHGVKLGARTTVKLPLGPASVRFVVEHTEVTPGHSFRDELIDGPFSVWKHTHRFVDDGDGSALEDELEVEPPLGVIGRTFGESVIAERITRLFHYRHQLLAMDLKRHAAFASQPRKVIAITGATGMVGSALANFLTSGGHEVRPMRRGQSGQGIDVIALEGADAVIHLAGAGIADKRWSDERKRELFSSRVNFTRALVSEMEKLSARPKVLISTSGTGLFGDRGDEALVENSPPGPSGDDGAAFLTRICLGWEEEALAARKFGTRVALTRFGAVLSAQGGALAKLVPPVLAGVGGPVAGGKQWMSWISLEDVIGAIHRILMDDALSGPFNFSAPEAKVNKDFMSTLGHVLHRPTIAPVPAFALRVAFGEMADATLIPSQKVVPQALLDAGFAFEFPNLEPCFRFTLGRPGPTAT